MQKWRSWIEGWRFHLDWLQVEVSSLCNGSCTYCAQHCYRDHWQGGLMDRHTFERLEPCFPKTNLVFLQGRGEPLLHPDIWKMVGRVKAAGASAGFTTNGTLLDEANLERLLESGLDILAISLAGATPATHEQFRPACGFREIDEALLKLSELKRKRRREYPHLHLAFLLLRSNLEEAGELVDLASRWGASQLVISNLSLVTTMEMHEECILLHPEIWPRARETLEKAKNAAAARGILLHYHDPGVEKPQPVCPENVLKACFVSHRGDVSPCVFTNLGVNSDSQFSHYFEGQSRSVEPILFGNVNEQSLQDIWVSEKATEFRGIFRKRLTEKHSGIANLPAACAQCYKLLER